MFRNSHSVNTLATPEEVWALIKDVTQWRNWLLGVEQVRLNGLLVAGTQGLLYLSGNRVHTMLIERCVLGRLEFYIDLRFGVKMHLLIDVSSVPSGSKVKLAGELSGVMAILHAWGWGRNLKTELAPTTRRLGVLSQE